MHRASVQNYTPTLPPPPFHPHPQEKRRGKNAFNRSRPSRALLIAVRRTIANSLHRRRRLYPFGFTVTVPPFPFSPFFHVFPVFGFFCISPARLTTPWSVRFERCGAPQLRDLDLRGKGNRDCIPADGEVRLTNPVNGSKGTQRPVGYHNELFIVSFHCAAREVCEPGAKSVQKAEEETIVGFGEWRVALANGQRPNGSASTGEAREISAKRSRMPSAGTR